MSGITWSARRSSRRNLSSTVQSTRAWRRRSNATPEGNPRHGVRIQPRLRRGRGSSSRCPPTPHSGIGCTSIRMAGAGLATKSAPAWPIARRAHLAFQWPTWRQRPRRRSSHGRSAVSGDGSCLTTGRTNLWASLNHVERLDDFVEQPSAPTRRRSSCQGTASASSWEAGSLICRGFNISAVPKGKFLAISAGSRHATAIRDSRTGLRAGPDAAPGR